jgi:glycerate 2-kinase
MKTRSTARPVLVAPDSFKGTFSACAVADATSRGLLRGGLEVDRCPIADGGEGSLDVLLDALGGEARDVAVRGPLGSAVRAKLGLLHDGRTAIVEAAQAIGLHLMRATPRNAEAASSAGLGDLIIAAARAGARRILVAVGGSATTDGGHGAVTSINRRGGIGDAELVCLCDVRTPFEDAAKVYGPQKGADRPAVQRLSSGLAELAAAYPRDPRGLVHSGAGGGVAGGLWAGLQATLIGGAVYILDAIGFDRRLRSALAVVGGEGRLDAQSVQGKAISEVSRRAARFGTPAHAVVGTNQLPRETLAELRLASVREATTLDLVEQQAVALATELRGIGPGLVPK